MYKYDFSFIIPVYNNEQYIDDCIKSIINQEYNFKKLQIILINDGSIDDSLKKCREYSNRYSNITLIDQNNQGVSVARNNGIKNAEGKYILFLDSDDFVSTNLCKEVFSFFEDNYDKIDILTFPLINYKNNKYTTHFRYASLYSEENHIYDINKNPEVIQTTINVCVKNMFENNLLFDEYMSFAEDEKFVTEIVKQKNKIGYCSNCKYYYRKIDSSCTKKYYIDEKQFYSYTQHYKELLSKYPKSRYIKNLFLNTLKWRLDDDKLFPKDLDKKNILKYKEVIRDLLKNISVIDILSLSFLKKSIKLAIFELKGVEYKLANKNGKLILKLSAEELLFDTQVTIVIKKLEYNKYPIIRGRIDCNFIDKNKIKEMPNKVEIEKNYLFKDSHINNVFNYDFKICFTENNSINFSELFDNVVIKLKNKSYKLNYIVTVDGTKILINKMSLKQKIKKVCDKLNRR